MAFCLSPICSANIFWLRASFFLVQITGTFTPQNGQDSAISLAATTVTVPALVDRIDTAFIANAEEFDIASGTSFAEGTEVTLKANNYSSYGFTKWVVTGTENYTIKKNILTVTMDGDVTVEANFSRYSSGGSRKYIVGVESTENGTVTVAPRSVERGKTVTITAEPDEGYKLSTVTAVDSQNREIKLINEGGGVYTFTMPASKVTVRAEFTEGQTEPGDCEYGDDCAAKKFTDLNADAWYHKAVDYTVVNAMMNGISGSEFAPDADLSRAMMVQVLYNLEGRSSVAVGNVFGDVENGAWFAKAVTWAVNHDIIAGYGDGKFGPDDSLTREQMATILYRYAKYKGYDVTASDDLSQFADAAKVSDWAVVAMKSAVGAGLIAGKDDSKLDPAGTATRAEVAQILLNFCENIAK